MEQMNAFSTGKPVLIRDNWKEEEKQAALAQSPEEIHRFNVLLGMHYLVCNLGDESAYYKWTYIVPDCPTVDDFIDIASLDGITPGDENDLFKNAVDSFKSIWEKYGKDGLYIDNTRY